MNQQLALAIQLNDEAILEDFHWGDNLILQQHIDHLLSHPKQEQVIYLWGSAGCGKSHLLQACCQSFQQGPAFYLPLQAVRHLGPEIIEGLEQQRLLCIDDIDAIAGDAAWEEALFHLYNRHRENEQGMLMISAKMPPQNINIHLIDLRSRLSWGLVFQLNELSDQDKINTLQRHARQRGFELPGSVAQFLISRCARNMHDLHQLINHLDQTSLAQQRKITIPFVKSVLAL